MKKLESYLTPSGRKPFEEWHETLPQGIRARIDAYILVGGTKRSQVQDILRAERYWEAFHETIL